jgi:hypothetical protein
VLEVTVARAERPEIGDLSAVVLSDIRDRAGVFMAIVTDIDGARVCQGCPPSMEQVST